MRPCFGSSPGGCYRDTGLKAEVTRLTGHRGKGDGDRVDKVSRNRWLHRGREQLLLNPGWKTRQAVAFQKGNQK